MAPTLTGLAGLPNLRTISLHGCTAATQAADAALNKLLKALKAQRPPRVKVGRRTFPLGYSALGHRLMMTQGRPHRCRSPVPSGPLCHYPSRPSLPGYVAGNEGMRSVW